MGQRGGGGGRDKGPSIGGMLGLGFERVRPAQLRDDAPWAVCLSVFLRNVSAFAKKLRNVFPAECVFLRKVCFGRRGAPGMGKQGREGGGSHGIFISPLSLVLLVVVVVVLGG